MCIKVYKPLPKFVLFLLRFWLSHWMQFCLNCLLLQHAYSWMPGLCPSSFTCRHLGHWNSLLHHTEKTSASVSTLKLQNNFFFFLFLALKLIISSHISQKSWLRFSQQRRLLHALLYTCLIHLPNYLQHLYIFIFRWDILLDSLLNSQLLRVWKPVGMHSWHRGEKLGFTAETCTRFPAVVPLA